MLKTCVDWNEVKEKFLETFDDCTTTYFEKYTKTPEFMAYNIVCNGMFEQCI